MPASLRQVAEEAAVSQATASRVLSGHGAELFAPETRRRIEEVARRLGYRPNHTARALATGRTGLMTLWSYPPYQTFFGLVMAEMQRQAQQAGIGLLVADISARETGHSSRNVAVWPSDGILAMDCGGWAREVLDARPSAKTPIVSMGTSCIPDTDSVHLDLSGAFAEATRHLLAQGCRRIAYVTRMLPADAQFSPSVFLAPRDAYAAAMQEAGLEIELIPMTSASRDAAREATVAHVRANGCPDAFLCRNDDLAIGAYRGMCDLGIRVGEDVLLIGCDGIEETRFMPCPVSTIVLPVERMCHLAWEFMAHRLADPAADLQSETLTATLGVRESSQRKHA
jgi:LacI family transcriptional regulator